jgi:hypothetical protein
VRPRQSLRLLHLLDLLGLLHPLHPRDSRLPVPVLEPALPAVPVSSP